jgi:hypothetical protein
MLSFQKLDVYRCAIEFLAAACDLSAMECAAILDALVVLRVLDTEHHRLASHLLERIVAMLTRLCR